MRQPNFKLGWYIPHKIAALTHFHADVTQDDFMGIVKTGQELLSNASETFHVIIDNRVVSMPAPASLSQMKQMVPYMNHPQLRWVIVVKPTNLNLNTESLPIEQEGETSLKNVSSLPEAISFLRQQTDGIDWSLADTAFFPNPQ